jgi:hypothetical protein
MPIPCKPRTSAEILAAAIGHPLSKDNTGSAQFSFHVNQNNTVNSRNSTLGSTTLSGLSEPANIFSSLRFKPVSTPAAFSSAPIPGSEIQEVNLELEMTDSEDEMMFECSCFISP